MPNNAQAPRDTAGSAYQQDPGGQSMPARSMWLLWLLLSARMVVADRGDAVTLSLVALAPLAAAWAVVRFGPRLILPLLSFALVPSGQTTRNS